MKYCKSCVMPNTKPGVYFDEEGNCNACRNMKIKGKINWSDREEQLRILISKIKKNKKNKNDYDCLVPISNGGKDSWFQAHTLSKKFNCKVLCVNLSAHLPTKEGISNINHMIEDLNIDIIKITVKPSVHANLRLKAFKKLGEPNWTEHCLVFAGVFNMAKLYNVPLVVWGEDVAFEFGGTSTEQRSDATNLLGDNDLIKGKKISELKGKDISNKDLFFYEFPNNSDLKKNDIRSIYLSYFVNWDGESNFKFVKKRGFNPLKKPRKGHLVTYDNIDEKLCEINGWFKYLKFGFWFPTDEICNEIWNKRLTRKKGIEYLKKLNDDFPIDHFEDFLNFHNISEEEFFKVAYKFVNKKIFIKHNNFFKLKEYFEN